MGVAKGDGRQVDLAADETRLEDVDDLGGNELGGCLHGHDALGLVELDGGVGVLEVVALHELLGRLLVGVVDLLHVDFGNDVEAAVFGCHVSLLVSGGHAPQSVNQ